MTAAASKTAHALQSFCYAKLEATYNTRTSWAATDAIALMGDLKLEPDRPKARTKERVGTSSAHARVRSGLQTGKWTGVFYVKLSGAGVKPDMDPLLEAAFSTAGAVDSGVSVTYAFSSGAPKSLQLGKRVSTVLYEVANGAWVDTLTIELLNGEFKLTFSGGFASFALVYGSEVATGGALITETTVPYKLIHKGNIKAGGVVTIGSRTNGGVGYTISSVDDTANPPTMVITPMLEGAVAEDDAIVPVTPSQTLAGTVLEFVDGSMTLDGGSALGFVQSKTVISTGIYAREEASSHLPAGLLKGQRNVEHEVQVYFTDHDTGPFIGRAWDDANVAIVNIIGSTAGYRMKQILPKLNVDVVPIDLPDDNKAAMAMIKGLALQSAAEFDECSLVLY
jgi:hypothetical protein